MKEKLIVSLKPRAASVRRTRRVRRCAGVSVGLATASSRASGTDGTLSRPWMRTTSSTRSAVPSMSRRQDGGVTVSIAPSFTAKPSLVRIRTISSLRHLDAAERASRARCRTRSSRRHVGRAARDDDLARLAAAEFQDQLGRELEARHARIPDRRRARSGSAHRRGCRACGPSRAMRIGSNRRIR